VHTTHARCEYPHLHIVTCGVTLTPEPVATHPPRVTMRSTLLLALLATLLLSLQACAHAWTPAEMSVVSSTSSQRAQAAADRPTAAPQRVYVQNRWVYAGNPGWYGAPVGWAGPWNGYAARPVYGVWSGHRPVWNTPAVYHAPGGPGIHVNRTVTNRRTYIRHR
jgi:hypothetical protein